MEQGAVCRSCMGQNSNVYEGNVQYSSARLFEAELAGARHGYCGLSAKRLIDGACR